MPGGKLTVRLTIVIFGLLILLGAYLTSPGESSEPALPAAVLLLR